MSKYKHIHGIAGWLALIIISLMVLGPLMGMGQLHNEFTDAVEKYPNLAENANFLDYKQISWIIFWLSTAIGFLAGYRLWKQHYPESVRFAIIALWISGPIEYIAHQVAAVIIFGTPSGNVYGEVLSATIILVIAAGVWTAYLKFSSRVRNTYKIGQPSFEHSSNEAAK